MRSQGTWQRDGLVLILTLLLAPSAATFAQPMGAIDPDGLVDSDPGSYVSDSAFDKSTEAVDTIVSCAPWGGTYGGSSETRTGCFIQRNGSSFKMPWLIQDDNSTYNANYVMKGTNFVPMGGDERGGWHGWDMWTYLDTSYPDPTIRNLIYNRDLDTARLLRSNVVRIFLNVEQWGGIRNSSGQNVPFNTRLLEALDQFLWQANEFDMKVIVTFYDGLNTPTPACTGKLGNRNNSGWSEAQPYLEHVQKVVDRFKNDVRIAAWDVMNEPDHLSRMRPPCPNNTMYDMGWLTGWLQRVINEIRLRDTRHPVTVGLYGYFVNRFTGAINTAEYNDLFNYLNQSGQGNAFVGFHWYGTEESSCNTDPTCQSKFQSALTGLRSVTSMPVVVGEIGLADSGAGNPPDWNRTYLERWTRAWTDVASQHADGVLAWVNTDFKRMPGVVCGPQSTNECFFGMSDTNTILKPAGIAFRDRLYNCTTPYIRIKTAHNTYATSLGNGQELNQSTSASSNNLFVMDPTMHRFLFYLRPTNSGQYVKAFATSNEHLQLQPLTGDTFPWRFYHVPMSKRLTSGGLPYFEFAFKPRNNVYIFAELPSRGGYLGYNRKWIGPWETFRMECFNSP